MDGVESGVDVDVVAVVGTTEVVMVESCCGRDVDDAVVLDEHAANMRAKATAAGMCRCFIFSTYARTQLW